METNKIFTENELTTMYVVVDNEIREYTEYINSKTKEDDPTLEALKAITNDLKAIKEKIRTMMVE